MKLNCIKHLFGVFSLCSLPAHSALYPLTGYLYVYYACLARTLVIVFDLFFASFFAGILLLNFLFSHLFQVQV